MIIYTAQPVLQKWCTQYRRRGEEIWQPNRQVNTGCLLELDILIAYELLRALGTTPILLEGAHRQAIVEAANAWAQL